MNIAEKKSESRLRPLVVYMDSEMIKQLKNEASSHNISVSNLVRTGVISVLSGQDPYVKGYNDAIYKTKELIEIHIQDVDDIFKRLQNDVIDVLYKNE